jgi:predicted transcriptional regulator
MPIRSTRLQKKFIPCLLFISFVILTATAAAHEYNIETISSEQVTASVNGGEVEPVEITDVPYWQFLLWLGTIYVLTTVDFLYPKRLFFAIVGYRIVNPGNVLENSSRFRVYAFIKNKPGAYISEIVEQIGLDREIVKYHIKTLKAKKKIEGYKDGGKVRYFENVFVYNEDERKVISAFQSSTNQKIISEIKYGKCDTNSALASEFGLSRATISWYMKNLIETGLINETKEGRKTSYKINDIYINIVEKYIQQLQILQ